VLVGTKKALGMAVRRVDTGQRYTALRKRLESIGETHSIDSSNRTGM